MGACWSVESWRSVAKRACELREVNAMMGILIDVSALECGGRLFTFQSYRKSWWICLEFVL